MTTARFVIISPFIQFVYGAATSVSFCKHLLWWLITKCQLPTSELYFRIVLLFGLLFATFRGRVCLFWIVFFLIGEFMVVLFNIMTEHVVNFQLYVTILRLCFISHFLSPFLICSSFLICSLFVSFFLSFLPFTFFLLDFPTASPHSPIFLPPYLSLLVFCL